MTKRAVGVVRYAAAPQAIDTILKNILFSSGIAIVQDTVYPDGNRAVINANHGASLTSFGEDITIEIDRTAELESIVKCESRSTLATALFDYGQNKNNVSSILYGISQYFGNLSTLQVSEDVF